MEKDKIVPYSRTGNKEEDEILLEPYNYILQVPGKQIRATLAHAFNYWLKIKSDKLRDIGDIIQLLHNASLLIDDIQDNSVLRRGIPVAHNIYGVASTMNAANYAIFIALEKVLALNHVEGIQIYLEQLLELHRGQGMEIYWRDNYICPTEAAYKQMTIQKTGGLFNLAVRLMQLFSECKEDFVPLTSILGLYFQIRDDYCNLSSEEYVDNKGYCEDLSEGKYSFPIIHAIRSHPEDRQIITTIDKDILRQRTKDIEVKRYCVKLLEKFGSFTYTRTLLEELDKKARDEIARLGGNPLLIQVLDNLKSWKHTKYSGNE
ncbi:geranylgeranyl pyrophosphate synthase isoform X1 [Apis mellifera caucasica]|nr:geranylgeranyl pyrophosphate synthase isoform X3 [Apis mellifera]KAG6802383.1 geranylgeranyl pyrophosphate synthase isoform X1 [Apis mellifera caucasica]KAG9435637.1 geranylgeranyl pyrophosphate synthase isoform X1 [Apis mellifera carnica]|eukprot:XP_006558079.1 geranylgeranyl pyrophosphate synthase isoform X3 [Apis mellifera]